MQSFIEDVIQDVISKNSDTGKVIYILPSKRAGVFLKKILSKTCTKTVLAPEIYSIEDFIEKVSNLITANTTTQLFELYNAYLSVGDFEKESFDSFLKWGQILLQVCPLFTMVMITCGIVFNPWPDHTLLGHMTC